MKTEKHYYFCDDDKHTRQVYTEAESPRCVACGAVMTYGRYSSKYSEVLILKPGTHKLITGEDVLLPEAIIAT